MPAGMLGRETSREVLYSPAKEPAFPSSFVAEERTAHRTLERSAVCAMSFSIRSNVSFISEGIVNAALALRHSFKILSRSIGDDRRARDHISLGLKPAVCMVSSNTRVLTQIPEGTRKPYLMRRARPAAFPP